jgi:hypothetical protein
MSLLDQVDDKRHFRVGDDQAFVLTTGEKLYSLDDLSEAINLIDPDSFAIHVNTDKNDFANWVQHVFGEDQLAEALRAFPTPLRMMVSIEKYLRQSTVGTPPATPDPAPQTAQVNPVADPEPEAGTNPAGDQPQG